MIRISKNPAHQFKISECPKCRSRAISRSRTAYTCNQCGHTVPRTADDQDQPAPPHVA